jgi:hypothetical protein
MIEREALLHRIKRFCAIWMPNDAVRRFYVVFSARATIKKVVRWLAAMDFVPYEKYAPTSLNIHDQHSRQSQVQ